MSRGRQPDPLAAAEIAVRYDKWLWAARLFKTRSIAAEAIDAGHIKVNGQRCKPARIARAGDRIELIRGGEVRDLMVLGISALRGPATVAQTLYQETDDSRRRSAEAAALRRLAPAPTEGAARPTKRERRALDRWTNRGD